MCIWNIFSEDISISYLPHVVNTCIINVIMAYALGTHQNRLSETALVCIWNILSNDISRAYLHTINALSLLMYSLRSSHTEVMPMSAGKEINSQIKSMAVGYLYVEQIQVKGKSTPID